MQASKKITPMLIALTLLSLIGLQIIWLFNVYEQKKQELKDKTREAIIATSERIQKAEDSNYILKNFDSLLISDTSISTNAKDDIHVILQNIKNNVKSTLIGDTETVKRISTNGDSTISTTIINLKTNNGHKIIVKSNSTIKTDVQQKAENLQSLFLKMAVNAKENKQSISTRINFNQVSNYLNQELNKRGVDVIPSFCISYFNNSIGSKTDTLNKTLGYKYSSPTFLKMPLFTDDFFNSKVFIDLAYNTTTSYLIKQMTGLLILSICITILVCFVMIYVFKKMLSQEKLNQLKTDFINNMSHELKTPIATISLAIDSINNPAVNNSKISNYTNIIKEENNKLNQHTERLLQMALFEKNTISLDKKTINLNTVIQKAINANQLKIEAIKANLIYNEETNNAFINGDEFVLINVISNLIDNSLKYSNTVCNINISLTKNNNQFIIKVSDNGIGIEEKELPFIFDKFYRVQKGNLHEAKGFGLGLSYVKSIINLHNGTIEAHSEIKKGSTFIIKLKENAN